MLSGIKEKIARLILLAILSIGAVMVIHADPDILYCHDCPAYQLKHNPGSLASDVDPC